MPLSPFKLIICQLHLVFVGMILPQRERTSCGCLRGGRTEAVRIWLFWGCDAKPGWLWGRHKTYCANLIMLSYSGSADQERQDPPHWTECLLLVDQLAFHLGSSVTCWHPIWNNTYFFFFGIASNINLRAAYKSQFLTAFCRIKCWGRWVECCSGRWLSRV